MAETISGALGENTARAVDAAAVEITVPVDMRRNPVAVFSQIESLDVQADTRAVVVVNERTGTVVMGASVTIREVAVAHGGIEIAVRRTPFISQPGPLSPGRTATGAVGDVDVREGEGALIGVPATSNVADLVKALNTIGAKPRDLISILQAIQAAGALDAELEVL